MYEKYYSVDQIAALLAMHPKTIQRYIREGRLKANKLGKNWRVSGHDLSVFLEGSSASTAAGSDLEKGIPGEQAVISAVIDIPGVDREQAMRIVNTLTAVLNVKPPGYGRSTLHTQYIEPDRVLRIMLWGNIFFMEAMMSCLSGLTQVTPAENFV
ncbi:MAG: helix-turn-helix domain-containing protein [Syntrophomonadaceae bacterium]|nr:helix-turn-helix domain-containing protein [Syntrophomonadaceae bacterium]